MMKNDLIARLEKATMSDRELDCLIYGNVHWPKSDRWRAASIGSGHPEMPFRWTIVRMVDPHEIILQSDKIATFTESLDAALPGERIVGMTEVAGVWTATAIARDGSQHSGQSSANEAIARRIAALKARQAS